MEHGKPGQQGPVLYVLLRHLGMQVSCIRLETCALSFNGQCMSCADICDKAGVNSMRGPLLPTLVGNVYRSTHVP